MNEFDIILGDNEDHPFACAAFQPLFINVVMYNFHVKNTAKIKICIENGVNANKNEYMMQFKCFFSYFSGAFEDYFFVLCCHCCYSNLKVMIVTCFHYRSLPCRCV